MAVAVATRMTTARIEAVIEELVQLDGDVDTIGSIAGQIAGTKFGFSRLPAEMIAGLDASAAVVEAARRFGDHVAAAKG